VTRCRPPRSGTRPWSSPALSGPHRSAEELRELSRYAAAHQRLEEVEHLRHRIATLLCTDNPEEESSLNPSSIHP
jgi:hypothetical protein